MARRARLTGEESVSVVVGERRQGRRKRIPLNMSLRCPFNIHVRVFKS